MVSSLCPGLGKTLYPRLETLLKQVSLLYFGLFKQQTVDYFDRSIGVFWDTPITAPAVFFFCENDAFSDAQVMKELIDYWQKKGVDVTAKNWENSTHAGHLKSHPEDYLNTLDSFLHSIHMAPLKAKM